MKKLLFLILFASKIYTSQAQGFFSKELITCIVELDKKDSLGNLVMHGTGFALHNYSNPSESIIVTCAHILRNSYIYLKIPMTDSGILYLNVHHLSVISYGNSEWTFDGFNLTSRFELEKNKTFITNDSLDIGIFKLLVPISLIDGKDTILLSKFNSIPRSLIKTKNEIELGTAIYFLGFPFEIGSKNGYFNSGAYSDDKINPLLRTGVLAWKSNNSKEFLLDAISYGGNSGSPVFTQTGIFGAKPALIGMVLGHLSDFRYSNNVDINYGLARCIWVNEILQLAEKLK